MSGENKAFQTRLQSISARLDAQECASRRWNRLLSIIVLVLLISGVVGFVCAVILRDVQPALGAGLLWASVIPLVRLPTPWAPLDREETLTKMRVCEQSGNQEALAVFNRLLLSGAPLTSRRLKPVNALLEQGWEQARIRERQEVERVRLEAFLVATDGSSNSGKKGEAS